MKKIFGIFLVLLITQGAQAQGAPVAKVHLPHSFFKAPDPLAPEWNSIPEITVPLFPQNITTPSLFQTSVAELKVKAIHNGKYFAVRLEWKDKAPDSSVSADRASDACAIQFPLKEISATSPFMGNKGAPVSILHWKAIWQQDINKGYQRVVDLYPNTWVDTDRFGIQAAIDLKNPLSQPGRKIPVEELFAEGFGTLTTQPVQNAGGNGFWKEGKWAVVLVRPLKTRDKNDPVLKAGAPTAVAFAIWEGGIKNVGARKNYAPWMTLNLE